MSARAIDEPHRAASQLELLFDLIFVAAIAAVTAQLADDIAGPPRPPLRVLAPVPGMCAACSRGLAHQALDPQLHDYAPAAERKVGQATLVTGVHALGRLPALRARHGRRQRPGTDQHDWSLINHLIIQQRGQPREQRLDQV